MPDLELNVATMDSTCPVDVLYAVVKLGGVSERSLDEQSAKILPCISTKNLINELNTRGL